jgi:putative pyruvate formate lyase activating enzyme
MEKIALERFPSFLYNRRAEMKIEVDSSQHKKLARIDRALEDIMEHETACRLCPRECGADRKRDDKGYCGAGQRASLSHALLHFGEEPVLSGCWDSQQEKSHKTRGGSGTLFFAGCNLRCSFCQNYQLSWLRQGKDVDEQELSGSMLDLQSQGALNINLVSPTHLLLPILKSLKLACTHGLGLPIVYNSNGYEKPEAIKSLEGIIDIYLPDLKFFSAWTARRFSDAEDYFEHAGPAVREMVRQQPLLLLNREETALKGTIIRHLVLPGQTSDSIAMLEWIASHLGTQVCLSVMSQYRPCFKAPPEIQRPLAPGEYREVLDRAQELGFETLFIQPEAFSEDEHLIPDFNLTHPFKWR